MNWRQGLHDKNSPWQIDWLTYQADTYIDMIVVYKYIQYIYNYISYKIYKICNHPEVDRMDGTYMYKYIFYLWNNQNGRVESTFQYASCQAVYSGLLRKCCLKDEKICENRSQNAHTRLRYLTPHAVS